MLVGEHITKFCLFALYSFSPALQSGYQLHFDNHLYLEAFFQQSVQDRACLLTFSDPSGLVLALGDPLPSTWINYSSC